MEILLGVVSSLLLELYKKIQNKLGKEVTRRVIHLSLFILSVVWVVLTQENIITMEAVAEFVKLLGVSVGTYELLIKNLYKLGSSKS